MNYCGNCKFLFPKEINQSGHKEHHVCRKYNQRVIHAYHHPELVRLNGCEEPLNKPIKEKT